MINEPNKSISKEKKKETHTWRWKWLVQLWKWARKPSEDYARCCTSARWATSSIAKYEWTPRFAIRTPPITCSSSVGATYKVASGVFFSLLWLFLLLDFFSFQIWWLFCFLSSLHTHFLEANTIYDMITSAQLLLRNYTVPKCKVHAIVKS